MMFSNPLTATLLGAAFGGLLISGGDERKRKDKAADPRSPDLPDRKSE